jgi:OOP family OmpA-OmpF porin
MSKRGLVAIALLFTPIVCEGADLGTYLGGSIGQGVKIEAVEDVGADSSDPSFKLFGGIGIGENFAVEIAYHDFGATTCCGPSYADFGFERDGKAFSANALALWPISRLRLFAKAGALWWDVDGYDVTIEGPRPYSNDGVDLMAGVGGDIEVVRYLRIRLEWERFKIDDDNADSVTVGALWRF